MARITAGVATSHVPAIGAALDLGKSGSEYWQPLFDGYDWSKAWIAKVGRTASEKAEAWSL